MVKNQLLLDTVLAVLSREALKIDPGFAILCEDSEDLGREIIANLGLRVQVDEDFKVRAMFSSLIGYAYDFTKKVTPSPREVYIKAVEMTKKLSGGPHFETFINSGIDNDSIGWYVTHI